MNIAVAEIPPFSSTARSGGLTTIRDKLAQCCFGAGDEVADA
jgi:hypothetical protein